MSPIKLVGFDLDDCLFDSTGLSDRARIKGINAMIDLGLKIDRQNAIKMITEVVKEYGSNSSNHYNYFIRRYNRLEDHKEKIPYSLQFKYISAAVMAYHKEKIESIKLYDDVKPCLIKLREKGLKSAIISDGLPLKQYEKILRLGIDDLIDLTVISDEIGIRKPNPKLFEFCLKKFNIEGTETIYIGDRLDKDIIPAKLCNINSILIRRGGKYDPYTTGDKIPEGIKPDYEIFSLSEIFEIIDELNSSS